MLRCPQNPRWALVQNSTWPCPTGVGRGGVRSCKIYPTLASLRVGVTLGNPPTPLVTFENLLRHGPPRQLQAAWGRVAAHRELQGAAICQPCAPRQRFAVA